MNTVHAITDTLERTIGKVFFPQATNRGTVKRATVTGQCVLHDPILLQREGACDSGSRSIIERLKSAVYLALREGDT